MIKKCDCSAELVRGAAYQDEMYGIGMRVHTPGKSSGGPRYTCTACGKGMRSKDALALRELEKAGHGGS